VRIANRVLEGITCIRLDAAKELVRELDRLASRRGYQVTYSVGWAFGTRDALGKVRESAWEAAIDGRGEVGERCADDACQDPRCAHPAYWIGGTPPPASPAAGAAGCLAETSARPGRGFRADGGARPAAAKRSEERNEISYECRQHWLRFSVHLSATPAD
jgi:hypothetical protein